MSKSGKPAPFAKPYKLYAKLGLKSEASADEIRSAYRVLEEVYRPGGAYLDDVMQLAFSEIANAAAILSNPKTRRLYDRGYIDETGRPTKIALAARRSRKREAAYSGAFFAVALAGLALFATGGEKPQDRNLQTTQIASGPDVTAPQAMKVHEPIAAPPVEAPRPPPGPVLQNPSQTQPSKAEKPVKADDRNYLPPETIAASKAAHATKTGARRHKSPIWRPDFSLPPRKLAERGAQPARREPDAHALERRRVARLSRAAPQMPQSYIWFGGPAPGPVRASQTLKSAHCLACLTDHEADCSRACH